MEEPLRIGYYHIWIFNMEEYCRFWHCVRHLYIRSSLDYIGLLYATTNTLNLTLYWGAADNSSTVQYSVYLCSSYFI